MSYLALTKRIMQDELTTEELIDCLNIPNVLVIQHTIIKILEEEICDPTVRTKLLEYSTYMDKKFKVLGLCKIGHLSIYALKTLKYTEEFQRLYEKLSNEDKEQIMILEKAFS